MYSSSVSPSFIQAGSTRPISRTYSAVSPYFFASDIPSTISIQTSEVNEVSSNRDADIFKNNYVFLVIIILIGVFVLFFSIFVITYIYFKCCRKVTSNSGKNDNEWQANYKSLDFEAMQLEATGHQVNLEQRGRFISDSSYLSPVFVRSESQNETSGVPNNEIRCANNEVLPESELKRQDTTNKVSEVFLPPGDLTEHVYIEITEDDREMEPTNVADDDGHKNGDGMKISKSSTLRRESAYVNGSK